MRGILAVVFAYVLALQGLTGTIVQGAAAGASQNVAVVICSPFADLAGTNHGSDPGSPGDGLHKFCAALCQMAGAPTAALPAAASIVHRHSSFQVLAASEEWDVPAKDRERPHLSEARAPPRPA